MPITNDDNDQRVSYNEYRVSYGESVGPHGKESVGFTYVQSAVAVANELKRTGEKNVRLWTREVTHWTEVT